MTIKRPRRAAIESSALSDMAFLLIIYFIVIAGFNINRGFLLNLPQKDSVRMVRKDELLRFRLDGEGTILFEDRVMDRDRAEERIRAAIAVNPNLAVVLGVAPETPWQDVVSFVELAQKSEVVSFSFSLEKNGEGGR
ncbi:MAG: biopolymer transporter ExbD [Treponema sp.]|jgi:biopolymer transport protein ExbD|nr:biopolymer transporter ExbD [Treponema sp.]